MYLIARWFISALALLGAAYLIPGIHVAGFYTALLVALVLGLVNAIIRPLLILLTFPITILTLGFFVLIINGLLFWFVGTVVQGFAVDSFGSAFLGALIVSLLSWLGNQLLHSSKE